jgi:hypothetical protein
MDTGQNGTARSAWALPLGPWIAPIGAALMLAGALVPYRYLRFPAVQPEHAQTLIDLGAGGGRWWFASVHLFIVNLWVSTILLLAVVSAGSVILRVPDLGGRGLQIGTGSIGTLFMAGLVGATWMPPASPAVGAYLWMAGGILLLLSGAFLPGDRATDAPVSPGRRGPLLILLAVAVGLFATAEVTGAVNPRNYVASATLWVVGTVVLLAVGAWAVVAGTRASRTNPTALRRASVAATVIAGAALVVAGHLVPVGMFPEAFRPVRADRLIFLETPQHWTGIAFDAVFPVAVAVLALAVAVRAPSSRTSPAILAALGAVALAGFISEMWDPAIHPAETLAAGGFLGLAGGVLLLIGALLARPRGPLLPRS